MRTRVFRTELDLVTACASIGPLDNTTILLRLPTGRTSVGAAIRNFLTTFLIARAFYGPVVWLPTHAKWASEGIAKSYLNTTSYPVVTGQIGRPNLRPPTGRTRVRATHQRCRTARVRVVRVNGRVSCLPLRIIRTNVVVASLGMLATAELVEGT